MKRKFLSAPVLLIALVLFNNPMQAQVKNESDEKGLPKSINISSVNSNGAGETEMNYTQDGRRYKVHLSGSKIVEIYIDDKKIAEADYPKYEPAIRKIIDQVEEDRKEAALHRAEAEKHREQARKDRELVNKMREGAEKHREEAEQHRLHAQQDRERAKLERQQADRERERAHLHREQAEKERAKAEVNRKKAEENRKEMQAMFDELVNDKLVPDRESLTSLELDETKLIVNRKEQPAAIHERYKQKYLKESRRRLQYRSSGGNQMLTVN